MNAPELYACLKRLDAWPQTAKQKWADRITCDYSARASRVPDSVKALLREVLAGLPTFKFNQWHDPHNGRFTFGPGGGVQEISDKKPDASSWGKPKTLNKHFRDHGKDFGATSPQDYADKAHQFYQRFQDEKLPAVQGSDGVVRAYDPETNTLGIYNPDGTTASFYKPEKGADYFQQQINKDLSTGGRTINPLPRGGGGGGGFFDPSFTHPGRNPWEEENG